MKEAAKGVTLKWKILNCIAFTRVDL
jgi:hypothetical protein